MRCGASSRKSGKLDRLPNHERFKRLKCNVQDRKEGHSPLFTADIDQPDLDTLHRTGNIKHAKLQSIHLRCVIRTPDLNAFHGAAHHVDTRHL